MSGTNYQVMNIDYEKQILTIADYLTYLHEKCPLPSSGVSAFHPSLFNYTGNDHIVSFFNCPGQIVGDHPDFYQLPCDQTNYYYTMLFDYTFNESYSIGYEFQPGSITCISEYQVPVHASYVNDLTNATEYKRVVTLKEALLEGFDLEWIPGMVEGGRNYTFHDNT
ncbi:hypothetical protein QJS04_geneDACA018525 [Acorus gramineus]|uniref:Uncharacterized protein n=1 Tax=Acorus gramineus TaxID=55184 RepID=A0AAV9AZR5_ACOGR|nr:hypothetical protein QJS04_geneDACA018525 [Acorus gramineus]